MNITRFIMFCAAGFLLAACQPSSDPPPDVLKTQRNALNKAKAVEGQLQKGVEEREKLTADQQAEK